MAVTLPLGLQAAGCWLRGPAPPPIRLLRLGACSRRRLRCQQTPGASLPGPPLSNSGPVSANVPRRTRAAAAEGSGGSPRDPGPECRGRREPMGVPTPGVSTCVRGRPGVCARVIGVRSRSVPRLSQRSPGHGSGRDWLLLPRLRDVPGSASPYLRAAPRGASLGAQGAHPSERRHQLPPKRPATPRPPPPAG